MMHVKTTFLLTNTGRSCWFSGYPTLLGVGTGGLRVPLSVSDGLTAYGNLYPTVLKHGEQGQLWVGMNEQSLSTPTDAKATYPYTATVIVLPDGRGSVSAPGVGLCACGLSETPFGTDAPRYGLPLGSPKTLGVSLFPLPQRSRNGTAAQAGNPYSYRSGSVLHYAVSFSNGTKEAVRFHRCPRDTVVLKSGTGDQVHTTPIVETGRLDCAAIRTVPPGQTREVSFTIRLPNVTSRPGTTPTSSTFTLTWKLDFPGLQVPAHTPAAQLVGSSSGFTFGVEPTHGSSTGPSSAHTNGGAARTNGAAARFTGTVDPFATTVVHPGDSRDSTTFEVPLTVTNTGTASGWPKCLVIAKVGRASDHRAVQSYWPVSKIRPGATVHAHVWLTQLNDGVRTITEKDVRARCQVATGPGRPTPPKPHATGPAPGFPSIRASDVGSLQMFTAHDGVAIGGVESSHGLLDPAYLLSTSDGAASWSVIGRLTLPLTKSDLATADLAFENEQLGYIEVYQPELRQDVVLVTYDGGQTWGTLTVPGDPVSISLDTGTLWVITNACSKPTQAPAQCPSRLVTYRASTPAPPVVQSIPVETPALTPETELLYRLGPTAGVFGVGGHGSHHALIATSDAGRQWHVVPNPCGRALPAGVVVPTLGRWLLLCETGGSMHTGNVSLYATGNEGVSWQIVAAGHVTTHRRDIGNIGTRGGAIAASGDGRTLWLVTTGTLRWSQDGGTEWNEARGATLATMGDSTSTFATAGTTDAWLTLPFEGLYSTADGTTWHPLP